VLSELIWFLKPTLILNLHSHPPEVGSDLVLCSRDLNLVTSLKAGIDLDIKIDIRDFSTFKRGQNDKMLCGAHSNDIIDNFFIDSPEESLLKSVYISVNSDFMSFDKEKR